MKTLLNYWEDFAQKRPDTAKWVREGGTFLLASTAITILKYILLQFLPYAFTGLPVVDFGFPGIDVELFGERFQWNIIGYDANHGGISMVVFFVVNKKIFPSRL